MTDNNGQMLTPEQIASKGEKIYQEKLRAILEPKENGRFVMIEVLSGEYFLGDSILDALKKARVKYPDSIFHTIKVGYEGVFKMGYVKSFGYGCRA
ncbi:MAG: hypothetical protein PHS79_01600 [Patescibacteria group bacterium]|nr:hypothetical protein [Patescibacteria group bacterium]